MQQQLRKRDLKGAEKQKLLEKRLGQIANLDSVENCRLNDLLNSQNQDKFAAVEFDHSVKKEAGTLCIVHELGLKPWPAQITLVFENMGRE